MLVEVVERSVTMLRSCVLLLAKYMLFAALTIAAGSVSGAWAQSQQSTQMSPVCSCADRPKNQLHAMHIVAACTAIVLDNSQPTSKRLEAMKRRLKISRLAER